MTIINFLGLPTNIFDPTTTVPWLFGLIGQTTSLSCSVRLKGFFPFGQNRTEEALLWPWWF